MLDAYDTYWSVVGWSVVLAAIWAVLWWTAAVRNRRNDIADVAWGLLFPLLALLTGGVVVGFDPENMRRATIVCTISVLWGLRLATHIGRRAIEHDGEDKRYAALRERWNGRLWRTRSLVQVFLLQAAITIVVAQPLLIAASVHDGTSTLGWLDYVALAVCVFGFTMEMLADRSLRRFMRRKQQGKTGTRYLTTGIWAWSRHPNYAGDSIGWFGFGLFGIAAALDADAPWLIVPAVIGPLVMFGFLRYGSGVPMTEKGRAGNEEWDDYVARTAVFFPRPPLT